MLDTVIKVAIGFYLGRTFYLEYTKQQALKREQEIRDKIILFLQENGLSLREATEESDAFLSDYEYEEDYE